MKLSRTSLKSLILEEINKNNSILLEMPEPSMPEPTITGVPIVGQEQTGDHTKDPDDYDGEMAKRSLYHMAAQAQQLHDMVREDDDLEPWVQEKISLAADYLEKAFKAITYDKGPGQGRQ
tara:strand:- start:111 stop:470 length:360 start_codon:yes stop_codon:yes gene_type:complete